MLVINAGSSFNEAETGKRTVLKIGVVGGQRSNVVGINTEGIRRITNRTGRLSGAGARGML